MFTFLYSFPTITGTCARTRRREVGGGDAHTHTCRCRTTHRPDSPCSLFFRVLPLFPPFLPLHITGMPSTYDGRPCAHPRCPNKFRDVKEGTARATVNDWAGWVKKGVPRVGTCPQSGEPALNLRCTASPWQTVDAKLSTSLGSELCEEQVRLLCKRKR